jgi:hypothetical protein
MVEAMMALSRDAALVAEEIRALSPPDKLRLSADLMEAGRGDLAHPIAESVVTELGAALALRRMEERRG